MTTAHDKYQCMFSEQGDLTGSCIENTRLLRKVCSNCMNFKLCACLQMGMENKVQKALCFFFQDRASKPKKCSWLGFISVRTKLRRAWYIFLILNLDHFKTLCKIYCFSELMGRNDNDTTSTGADSFCTAPRFKKSVSVYTYSRFYYPPCSITTESRHVPTKASSCELCLYSNNPFSTPFIYSYMSFMLYLDRFHILTLYVFYHNNK